MPPGELSGVSRNYEILALATVWALSACAIGPILGAYGFLVADVVASPPSVSVAAGLTEFAAFSVGRSGPNWARRVP